MSTLQEPIFKTKREQKDCKKNFSKNCPQSAAAAVLGTELGIKFKSSSWHFARRIEYISPGFATVVERFPPSEQGAVSKTGHAAVACRLLCLCVAGAGGWFARSSHGSSVRPLFLLNKKVLFLFSPLSPPLSRPT